MSPVEPPRPAERGLELLVRSLDAGHEALVPRELLETLLRDAAEHADRVAAARVPEIAVHADEQALGVPAPGVPEVHRHVPERLKARGKIRRHDERIDPHETESLSKQR